MFFQRKKRSVDCKPRVLFEILEEDLRSGLCTDILFQANGKKHRFGAWGDAGKTVKNVVFYFDQTEFSTLEELRERTMLGDSRLADSEDTIIVTECNGCYPESTPQLRAIMERD